MTTDRFRQIQKRARTAIMDRMGVPAKFCEVSGETESYKIWTGRVRVWNKRTNEGDLKGTNYHYSEFIDDAPRIIFMISESEGIKRGVIVGIAPNEIYSLDSADMPDRITQSYKASRLKDAHLQKFAKLLFPADGIGSDS